MKTASLALGCALVLVLSGCGGHDTKPKADTSVPPSTPPATGLVQGTLMEVGGPSNNRHPISGTVTFTGASGSVTKAPVDKTGKFAIGLYPGDYRIQGRSPLYESGRATCNPAKPTTSLPAGKTVTVNVYCQLR